MRIWQYNVNILLRFLNSYLVVEVKPIHTLHTFLKCYKISLFFQVEDVSRAYSSTTTNICHVHIRILRLSVMFAKYPVFTSSLSGYSGDTRHFRQSSSPLWRPNSSLRGHCMVVVGLVCCRISKDTYTARNSGLKVKQLQIKARTCPLKAVIPGCCKDSYRLRSRLTTLFLLTN
jgi:hypothetical protein